LFWQDVFRDSEYMLYVLLREKAVLLFISQIVEKLFKTLFLTVFGFMMRK